LCFLFSVFVFSFTSHGVCFTFAIFYIYCFSFVSGVWKGEKYGTGEFLFSVFVLSLLSVFFGSVWNDRKAAERIFMNIYSCHEVGWVERIWNMGHNHVAMDFCL
jgi:hypothetical protein